MSQSGAIAAWQLQATIIPSSPADWGGRKKQRRGDFRELGAVPRLSVAISHRPFNQRCYFAAIPAS